MSTIDVSRDLDRHRRTVDVEIRQEAARCRPGRVADVANADRPGDRRGCCASSPCSVATSPRTASPRPSALPFKPSDKTRKDTSVRLGATSATTCGRGFLYGGKPILIAAVLATALALVLGTIDRPDRRLQPAQARRRADALDGRDPGPAADHLGAGRDLHVRSLDDG